MRVRELRAGRIVTLGLERPPSGVVAIELDEAMAARRRPTAMIAQNDVTALELINRLEAGGLRVPADVSVIGYDDIPAARLDRISLTTLRQDTPRLVERAAALRDRIVQMRDQVGKRMSEVHIEHKRADGRGRRKRRQGASGTRVPKPKRS